MQTAEAQKDAPSTGPVFDEDEVPAGKLDDAEIARLVSLSSQAAYHRTDNIPVKPKESFEPRTLVTIAMDAQRRREAELQASSAEEVISTVTPDDVGPAGIAETAHNLSTADMAKNSTVSDAEKETAVADVADEKTTMREVGDLEADEIELSEEQIAAAAAAEKMQAEYDRGVANGRVEGEEAGRKAGHDKGYEAGRAAGQAEATAQLETAIQGFEKATLALASSAALDLDALTVSIHDTILLLASERAGMAITEMPEGFARRIESILLTIKKGTDHPQISLNPDDLLALKPIIATREKLQNCRLDADESLAPGDLRLVIDGIGIEDELHRRVNRKATTHSVDAPAEEELTYVVDAETDIAKREATKPTAVEPADNGPDAATTASDEMSEEISATPEAKGGGGFSIGLNSKAKADDAEKAKVDDAKVSAVDGAGETGADQS